MALTDQQLATVARQAGFTGGAVAIAVAVALAESGGNPSASHVNSNGSIDRGLWQINSIHNALVAGRNLNDPAVNAQMAYQLSGRGSNWRPWTTFTSGAYRKYISRGVSVAGGPNVSLVGLGVGDAGDSAASGPSLEFFTNTSMYARVGVILLGVLLLLFGLWRLAMSSLPIPGIGKIQRTLRKVRR